jgi:hypothetical protein
MGQSTVIFKVAEVDSSNWHDRDQILLNDYSLHFSP